MVPGTLVVLVALLAQIVPPDFARHPSRKLWRDGISGWGPEVTAAWMAKRTPRTSWTRRGWNAFRWGMGPADVADRLRDANGDFRASAPEGWDICVSVKGAEPAEARCYVHFEDHALMLWGAAVSPEFGPTAGASSSSTACAPPRHVDELLPPPRSGRDDSRTIAAEA